MLGQLVEADEGEVELRLLSDADYADYYEAVENELIDQYLEDALSAEEHIQFEQHFLKAPERRDDLAFSAALRQAAQENLSDRQPAMRPVLPKKRDAERHFWAWLRRRRALAFSRENGFDPVPVPLISLLFALRFGVSSARLTFF